MRRRFFVSGSMLAVLALPLSPAIVRAQDFDGLVRQAAERNEPPRVYRRVKHSKDEPYDEPEIHRCLSC